MLSFFVMLWGFKGCHFCLFGTINEKYISRYYRISADLIRLRNRFKLFEGGLFAKVGLLLGAKSITYFIWLVGG